MNCVSEKLDTLSLLLPNVKPNYVGVDLAGVDLKMNCFTIDSDQAKRPEASAARPPQGLIARAPASRPNF